MDGGGWASSARSAKTWEDVWSAGHVALLRGMAGRGDPENRSVSRALRFVKHLERRGHGYHRPLSHRGVLTGRRSQMETGRPTAVHWLREQRGSRTTDSFRGFSGQLP